MTPSKTSIENFHSRILELEKKYNPIRISKIKRDCEIRLQGGSLAGHGCLAGTTRIEIDPSLNVRACCMSTETLGNLNNQTFDEMWYSVQAENIRNKNEPYCLIWKNDNIMKNENITIIESAL